MFIFQDIDGKGLSQKAWQEKRLSQDWTFREFRNGKIWIRLSWVGRYPKKLPSEYRQPFGITVYNRLKVRESEWTDEDTLTDKGWVEDPSVTENFRTRSAAEAAYEDLLIQYTQSFIDVDEDTGEALLVEEDNDFTPVVAGSRLILDDEQLEAAQEKGIDVGGWS